MPGSPAGVHGHDNPSAPSGLSFPKIFGGFSVHEFTAPITAPTQIPIDATEGKTVVDTMDGGFIECAMNNCNGGGFRRGFYALIDRLHANHRPFMWFNGTKDPAKITKVAWFKGTQRAYFKFEAEGKIGPNDIVMIMNYGAAYPSVPEVTAALPDGAITATGILYWLLHQ